MPELTCEEQQSEIEKAKSKGVKLASENQQKTIDYIRRVFVKENRYRDFIPVRDFELTEFGATKLISENLGTLKKCGIILRMKEKHAGVYLDTDILSNDTNLDIDNYEFEIEHDYFTYHKVETGETMKNLSVNQRHSVYVEPAASCGCTVNNKYKNVF